MAHIIVDLITRLFLLLPSRSVLVSFRLEHDLDVKRLFVRCVSPEITTPLNIASVKRLCNFADDPDTAELVDYIRDSCKVVQNRSKYQCWRTKMWYRTGPTYFQVDGGKITQVLHNFISNAMKFTPEQGVVRVEATESEGFVTIRVIDSGEGIARIQGGLSQYIWSRHLPTDPNCLRVNCTTLDMIASCL
jgi:hypothetical protein